VQKILQNVLTGQNVATPKRGTKYPMKDAAFRDATPFSLL